MYTDNFTSVGHRLEPGPYADTILRRLDPLPNLNKVSLEDGLKESPKYVTQK
jgi:hypothetical protein